jgi:hypothetical protein
LAERRFFLRLEVVIVVLQPKELFRFSHSVVQLAVTHQHPKIQQVTAVAAGKISPSFLPPRLIFRLLPDHRWYYQRTTPCPPDVLWKQVFRNSFGVVPQFFR